MNTPLLSIYLPIYNHAEIIEGNLDFMAQEIRQIGALKDIEIVISDNASTDDTRNKVENFVRKNDDLNISYSRNLEDIGGNKNISHLWDKTKGAYVIMIGDDRFAKSGLVNIYSSIKENLDADIIILKNNTYTDYEYTKNASMLDVVKHIEKLQYIGNFILKRDHFWIDHNTIDRQSSYPHLIIIMNKIMDARKVIDTRFVAINILISWDFQKTIKIILKLPIDCLKITEMVKDRIDEKSYKLLVKSFNKSLYNSLRFIRAHKNRFSLFKYVWKEVPRRNSKVMISLALHCLPAPLFYFTKLIDTGFKYLKYCIQEMRKNRVSWKSKEFLALQDHVEDKIKALY